MVCVSLFLIALKPVSCITESLNSCHCFYACRQNSFCWRLQKGKKAKGQYNRKWPKSLVFFGKTADNCSNSYYFFCIWAKLLVTYFQYIHPSDAHKLGQAELVVIDEAAAIPLPLVKDLMGPYLVFLSSTVNGWEWKGWFSVNGAWWWE